MRQLQIIIVLTILRAQFACKDTNSPPSQKAPAAEAVNDSMHSNIVPPAKVLLFAWVDKLRLREKTSF